MSFEVAKITKELFRRELHCSLKFIVGRKKADTNFTDFHEFIET